MKFVVDMNISPLWVGHLNDSGHDAVHWSSIDPAYARDDQIVDS
jgi:predicted nuclease of predicted toxin-antitoxin system